MPDVGSEGIAWATVQGENYFFVCIDTAKSTGTALPYKRGAAQVQTCESNLS
jgi:hypothetical protein